MSPDSSVVFGCSVESVIAHNTTTGAIIWRKEMPGNVCALRLHGSVVVVPVSGSRTLVLDATTGHPLHALPSAGKGVWGVCVFDGLTSDVISFVDFLLLCYYVSTAI